METQHDNEGMSQSLADAVEESAATAPSVDGGSTAENPETVKIRVRKRSGRRHSGKKKRNTRRIAITVLCVILAIVLVAVLVLAFQLYKGKSQLQSALDEATMPAVVDTDDAGKTITYDGHTYVYNDDVVSVAFLGIDDETYEGYSSSCADADLVLTFDTSTNKVTCVNVPRDAMVEIDMYEDGKFIGTTESNLCLAYSVDADEETCAENSVKSISRILYNMPISKYFVLEVHSIAELANAVGGVEVGALETIPGTNVVKGQTISLTGEDALRYVQYRDTEKMGTGMDRQKRQTQFVKAFAAKASKLGAGDIVNLLKTVGDNSHTNISTSELTYLASCFVQSGVKGFDTISITGKTREKTYDDGLVHDYVVLKDKSVMEAVLAAFYRQMD